MSVFKDITGLRCGRLVALRPERRKDAQGKPEVWWECQCDCGQKKFLRGDILRRKVTLSCGCLLPQLIEAKKDLVGKRFGRLTVLRRSPKTGARGVPRGEGHRAFWMCRCDCGNETEVPGKFLRSGHTQSCGCLHKEIAASCCRKNFSGDKNRSWKGGRFLTGGYVRIMQPQHPNANPDGYVLEHVLVLARHLGRPLVKGERVHHLNGIKTDNRLENLELWTTIHPQGQRVSDMVKFCESYLKRYAPERVLPAMPEGCVAGE